MSDLPQPFFDPSQYPGYLDAQRKQQIAQMLMSGLQQANQTPADWNSMKVVPKRGMVQNMSVLADALLAGKGMNTSNAANAKYMQGLFGGGQPPAPIDPQQQAAAVSQAQTAAPGIALPAPDQPPAGLVQPPALQNPMIPPGMSRQQATMIAAMPGGMDALSKVMAANWTPLEIKRQLRSAGIDPDSQHGQSIQQAILAKQTTNNELVKPNETVFDANARQPIFTAPGEGVTTNWTPQGPVQAPIPGALEATQNTAAAKAAGAESQKPIKLGTDANGKDVYGFPTPPGTRAPSVNATAPSTTASPAVVQSQKSGAESGQTYASELSKNATGATEVLRSLSEMKNLAAQATPSAANTAKMKMGSFMIAAGAEPASVSKWLGVDVGALQAAQKQTATLAVNSIHSMTSRGTNFDLDTFMRNNPNLNLADPAAFARVSDYMASKAAADVAKQKDFANWKRTSGVSPDDWETQHTSHWLNEVQGPAIAAGESNSKNPQIAAPRSFATEAAAQAAFQSGQLKSGDKITINGKSGTWH